MRLKATEESCESCTLQRRPPLGGWAASVGRAAEAVTACSGSRRSRAPGTHSLSSLEAGIDSSCNDKIQYSGK